MHVDLGAHFTYKRIFRLTIAPILMMIFISLYNFFDGIIIAATVDNNAFAGVNLIWPLSMIIGGIGIMFGTGGAALTSKRLGERNKKGANNVFTLSVIFATLLGIILSIVCYFITEPVAYALGNINKESTNPKMIEDAISYGKILVFGQAAFILQQQFQSFFVVDEKPFLGFIFSLGAGITNIVFDLVFILATKLGVNGAAIATVMGFFVGGVGPVIYFLFHKNGNIRLIKPNLEIKAIFKSAGNGASEFINSVASSIVSIVFNIQLIYYFGQIGVEAYSVIQTVLLMFISIFIGYATSIAPAISYHYGAYNMSEVKNILIKSLKIVIISGIIMLILGESFANVLAKMFSNDPNTIVATTYAIRAWSTHFVFAGFVIYMSNFFTALNNGLVSGIIALVRTLLIQIACAFLLPLIFGKDAIWWSALLAEALASILAIVFLITNKKRYQY